MAHTSKPWVRAALVVAGLLAGLAAAELAVRIVTPSGYGTASVDVALALARPSPPSPDGSVTLADLLRPSKDPNRVYELRPGLDCTFRGARVTTNRHGMRDRELSMEKPDGVMRVVGLGDSVMFGWGVESQETYSRVVERMFVAGGWRSGDVRFLNFAVPGYNTAMQAALLRDQAARFDPDAVVIHFVNNDLGLPRFMLEPLDRWTLDRIWLADLVRGGWTGVAGRASWVSPRDVAAMEGARAGRVRAKYAHLAGEEPFRRAMADIAEFARARSVPVVFLTLKDDEAPWRTGAEAAGKLGFRVVVAGPRFLLYLADNGITADRDGWRDTFSVAPDDPHPNATGHRIYAELLVEALSEEFHVTG